MFRSVHSATPTPRKESLFDRIRRRMSQNRSKSTKPPEVVERHQLSRSRSTGTLVRAEDIDDRNSVNTSTLDSDSQPVVQRAFAAKHPRMQGISNQQYQNDYAQRQNQVQNDSRAEQERKRLVTLLSTQGVSLLQSLDGAMKRLEIENSKLKKENRKLRDDVQRASKATEHTTHRTVHHDSVSLSAGRTQADIMQVQQKLDRSANLLEERIDQAASESAEIAKLITLNNDLHNKVNNLINEKKSSEDEIALMKRQLADALSRQNYSEEYFVLQSKISDLQREKETNERQLGRDLSQAKDECSKLTAELNKQRALLNESHNENRQLTAKYEALVLQHAELTRSCKSQSELQKRVSEMAEDLITNDGILQATIQMAKKAEKDRKRVYGIVENTGKVYETYFTEYETDAQSLRAKLKLMRQQIMRNKKTYEQLLMEERAKNLDRLRAKDDELSYLRALLGTRDTDVSKAHGRYMAATDLLTMTLMMPSNSKTANALDGSAQFLSH